MNSFWNDAEVISVYTRQQAIEDGMLFDVTSEADKAGFKVPVAIALDAWSTCVLWSEYDEELHAPAISQEDRLNNLLNILYMVIKSASPTVDRLTFTMPYRDRETGKNYIAELIAVMGPGDNFEPVLTIMFPWEE